MGLVLDSSAAVAAERQNRNARQLLEAVALETGDDDIAVSVVTLLELAHGITRADTRERRDTRQRFLSELVTAIPVHPVTMPIAMRAGQIDGQSQARGIRIPLSDLLIGVTALELGYRIGTRNVRHFSSSPAWTLSRCESPGSHSRLPST